MTPEEKFMFDLEGYLVIRNALDAEELIGRIREIMTMRTPIQKAAMVGAFVGQRGVFPIGIFRVRS